MRRSAKRFRCRPRSRPQIGGARRPTVTRGLRRLLGEGLDPRRQGPRPNPDEIKYKEGDSGRFLIQAETTDKLAVFATNGRFYTLPVDKLPGGRGHGEPIRLMIDLANEHDIVTVFPWRPGQKLLLAATDGRGFVTTTDELLAGTRGGKQVMSLGNGPQARIRLPVQGDAVAFLGENRKMLIVKLDEIPELGRGRGVILQKYIARRV